MQSPIDRAKAHSHAVYLKDGTTSTVKAVDDLVDLAEDLAAKLRDLIAAADGITPSQEEFMDEQMEIDPDDWDDWGDVVGECRKVLKDNGLDEG